MLDSREDGKNKALENLKKAEIQEQLAEILVTYSIDLHDILTVATVHNSGVRPEGISNEIFSCFHHIARGLCLPKVDTNAELTAARKSHIKRAILDSYKVAINYILKEDEKLKEILDYLVLAEDFAKYIPDGMDKVNDIKQCSRKVKIFYIEAKRSEAKSDFDSAIEQYNFALEKGMELLDLLEIFTKDKVYLLACSREVSNKKEKKWDRFIIVFSSIVGACIGAFLTVNITTGNFQEEASKVNNSVPQLQSPTTVKE
jgi:hypothetical protein